MFSKLFISLLPVLLYLMILFKWDSYRLLSLRKVIAYISYGMFSAVFAYFLNNFFQVESIDFNLYTSTLVPLIEEMCKIVPVFILIKRKKIAFTVDAAICGFAVGTGFALIENIFYAVMISEGDILLWTSRGFGTAVMHGSVTAMSAIILVYSSGKKERISIFSLLVTYLIAGSVHAVFNAFLFSPLLQTGLQMVVLPILTLIVFRKSESGIARWINANLDSDIEKLAILKSGNFSDSQLGSYLAFLKKTYPGEIILDMFCYLECYWELSLKAKSLMMIQELEIDLQIDEQTISKIKEFDYLKRSIGRTGVRLLNPYLGQTGRDTWQLEHLREKAKVWSDK